MDFHGVSVLRIHLRTCISILDIFLISLPLHGYPGHLDHVRSFPFHGIYRSWTPQSPLLQTFENLLRLDACQRRKLKFVFVQGRIHILPNSRDILLVRLDRHLDTQAARKKKRFNTHKGLVDQPLNALMNRNTLGERRVLAARIPLFSASVIASVQAYRIRFVFTFLGYHSGTCCLDPCFHWVWPSG